MIKATVGSYAPVGKNALFAVDVTDGKNSHSRVVPIVGRSVYIAELLAIKYTCEAVDNKNVKLSVSTTLPFVLKVFEKEDNKWVPLPNRKRDKDKNVLVEEIRMLADKFDDFEVIHTEVNVLKDVIKKYSSI